MPRQPTEEEFQNYDGMHCRNLWREVGVDWKCPVCDRTKKEILVWGKRKGSNAAHYGPVGFKAGLHEHHDHGVEIDGKKRFVEAVICGSCNHLDARLKRHVGAERCFSFSPAEMKQCLVSVRPNDGIKEDDINFALAQEIYVLVTTKN